MSKADRGTALLVEVMLGGYRDVCVSQCPAGRVDAVRIIGTALTARIPAWLTTAKVVKGVAQPITIIEERGETVKRVFELAGLGLGTKRIANTLKAEGRAPFSNGSREGREWTTAYVGKILANRATTGEYQPRSKGRPIGDPIPGFYPAVIDFDTFSAARAQVLAKTRMLRASGKPSTGGGCQSVNSLFNPLVRDVTGGDDLPMVYHPGKNSYLVTKWAVGRKGNRHWLRYRRFESAFLGFLGDLDWERVAGESEPAELKVRIAELSNLNGEIDRTAKLIANRQAAMADPELDLPTIKVVATQIARSTEKLGQLTLRRESLGATVDSLRKSARALYSPEALMALVRSNSPESDEVRLRLKAEIAKRIARIDIDFGVTFDGSLAIYHQQDRAGRFVDIAPDQFSAQAGPLARIVFINGAERIIVLDGEKAVLLWCRPPIQTMHAQNEERDKHTVS